MRFVYILKCADESLYTGITTDLDRRILEHNTGNKGAKYTKVRRPVELVFSQECEDRSDASKKEYSIKQLTKQQKLNIIQTKILPE